MEKKDGRKGRKKRMEEKEKPHEKKSVENPDDKKDEINIDSSEEVIESEEVKVKKSGMYLIVFSIVILLIFLGVYFALVKSANQQPLTLDDYHQMNLEGKETEINYLYNGYSFVNFDGLWYTQLQADNTLFDVSLRFGPRDLEEVPIIYDGSVFTGINELYITIDPYTNDATFQTLGAAELSLNLYNAMGITPLPACIEQDDNTCVDLPIIDCTNNDKPVIVFREGIEGSVVQEDDCVIIEGSGFELIKAIDRFIYTLYGIMQD